MFKLKDITTIIIQDMFLSCNLNMFLYLTFNDDFELNGKRMKGIYLGKGGTSVTSLEARKCDMERTSPRLKNEK